MDQFDRATAEWLERRPLNPEVNGSSPTRAEVFLNFSFSVCLFQCIIPYKGKMSVMLALIYPEFVSCPSPLKHSLTYKPFNLIIDRSDQKSTMNRQLT